MKNLRILMLLLWSATAHGGTGESKDEDDFTRGRYIILGCGHNDNILSTSPHEHKGIVTVDIHPTMHPDFVGDYLEETFPDRVGRASFSGCYVEGIRNSVLCSPRILDPATPDGYAFFRNAYAILEEGAPLIISYPSISIRRRESNDPDRYRAKGLVFKKPLEATIDYFWDGWIDGSSPETTFKGFEYFWKRTPFSPCFENLRMVYFEEIASLMAHFDTAAPAKSENSRVKCNASGARNSTETKRRRCNEKIHAFGFRGKEIDKPLI